MNSDELVKMSIDIIEDVISSIEEGFEVTPRAGSFKDSLSKLKLEFESYYETRNEVKLIQNFQNLFNEVKHINQLIKADQVFKKLKQKGI